MYSKHSLVHVIER